MLTTVMRVKTDGTVVVDDLDTVCELILTASHAESYELCLWLSAWSAQGKKDDSVASVGFS